MMKTWPGTLLVACLWMVVQYTEAQKGTTCSCGESKKGRIVGGSKATAKEYPWVLKVVDQANKEQYCDATIINEKTAVSAAHCGDDLKKTPSSVIAGTSQDGQAGQIVKIERAVIHEKYDPNGPNTGKAAYDIAILYLASPLKFTATVSPICLPTGKMNINNKWVKAIGWGNTKYQVFSKNLNVMDVQVTMPCEKNPSTHFCFQNQGKSSCYGDSGGPIAYLDPETNRYTLVGVMIGGDDYCKAGTPSFATEVGPIISWINSNAKGCHKIENKGKSGKKEGKPNGKKKLKKANNKKY